MRKIFFALLFLLFLYIVHPNNVSAFASCPSETMLCTTLDLVGGCSEDAGCVKNEIFSGSCNCILNSTEEGTVPFGGICLEDKDCADGRYCWGLPGLNKVCNNTDSVTIGDEDPIIIPPTQDIPVTNLHCPTKSGKEGINTAIGCIPVENTNEFMGWILGWAIGIGGGIAFLLIVYASFMTMTSQGNPERLKAGQELLTSAISGLILLIFSVFILKFIGVDILKLDAFGFNR